jgi:hypothetical protein
LKSYFLFLYLYLSLYLFFNFLTLSPIKTTEYPLNYTNEVSELLLNYKLFNLELRT